MIERVGFDGEIVNEPDFHRRSDSPSVRSDDAIAEAVRSGLSGRDPRLDAERDNLCRRHKGRREEEGSYISHTWIRTTLTRVSLQRKNIDLQCREKWPRPDLTCMAVPARERKRLKACANDCP